MQTNFKILVSLLLILPTIVFSQRNPVRNIVSVHQLDPRFTFSIEKYWSGMADAESYYYYVKNNTADEYSIEIEVDLTLNCYDVKPYKLGINRIVYLKPNGEFTPKDDWVHDYMITSDRKKQESCLMKIGDTYTLYRSHTWQILNVVNLTQKKAADEKKKADEKNKKIEDDRIKKEAEEKTKAEAEKKRIESAKTAAPNKVEAEKTKKGDTSVNEKTSTSSSQTAKPVSQKDSAAKLKDDQKIKEEEAVKKEEEAAKKEAIRKEAEAKALREEEERLKKVQQEYDSWKTEAQKERDNQDIINTGTTLSIFTILGGFIYDGMGDVDPYSVYRSPDKKFNPKFFMNNDFGFSFSSEPILFQSSYSTMVNGKPSVTNSLKGEEGYYLNVNAESRIGVGNDYYSLYGLIGGKLGIVPTFNGSRVEMDYGGGIDLGIKNVKLFGQYKAALYDEKSISSSDVEENGSGDLEALSSEISYGLKFTFGGEPSDNYKRSHISLGMISKQYTIDGSTKYYDSDKKIINSKDIAPIEGYSIEWKKDHTFKLYIRYFDEYNYIGTVNGSPSKSSSLSSNGSFFEIGFLRSLDFF